MSLNDSFARDAALGWFKALGYEVGHGTPLAPGNPAAECETLGETELEW
jgi:hypothetical protein